MADIAGVVVSPIVEVGKWLAAPIWRQFKYLYNYTTNFKNLEKEVDKLKNTRDEVQHKVTAAERNVEEIKQNVKNWQKDVEKTIIEAEQLIQQKANNPRCFKGLCPNFIIHYKQSKKAFKLKRDDIASLLQQEKDLDPVSYPTNPPKIWLRSSEDYLAFESRNSTMKNVWDALNDNNVFMIGVYGMGGLGKTTLVQEAGRKAKEENLFEDIVFVEVSESPNIEKIQTTIADDLGLEFKKKSDRADELYSRMVDKNILLILDNVWNPLDLTNFGIPCGANRGKNKLLFTSRNVDVLARMDCTNNFGMGFLNDDEAWILFAKMAGNVIQVRKLYPLPNEVCKECGGLPIVICTIAKALKNKSDPSDWRVALQELRAPTPTKFTGFLEEKYMKIALSYEYLTAELKKTFLISSLLENNTSISDLFRHVVCLDILEGANLTMEEARDKLDKLVRDLKDACLLLGELGSEEFAMHDVVRTVAITIAYVDHHVFTARNDIEREWKDRDKLKKCTKISLPGNSPIISQLWPNYFNCPNLDYFYMTNMSESSFKFPEDIFKVMPKLRVMNLDGLQQSSLLSSIDLLTNLQSLCLDDSKVKDFAIIGKLKTLKVLSLQNSIIEEFPIELGQLIQLRLLDISNCRELKVVAPNVISQLSKLEEFYVKGCHIKWKHEVLEEVKLLSKLIVLELDINDNNVLPKDFFSKELERYKISIGPSWFDFVDGQKILQFKFNSIIYLEKLHGIKNVEVLQLDGSLVEENDTKASQVVLQSNETRPLFNKKVIFTDLMSLKLVNISFGMIWESKLSTSSYENLTKLILDQCNRIKYVFPFFVAKSLQQLQYLQIKNCEVLEKIVEEEEEGIEVVNSVFPHIIELVLRNLPKLTVFYHGAHALELPMLKHLEICNCPNFTSRYQDLQDNNEEGEVQVLESKSICLEHKVILTDLETLRLENISTEMIWESQRSTSSYENLTKLFLVHCNRIKYVFPFFVAKSLQQLQYLQIMGCEVLEKIVEEEDEGIEVVNYVFPHIIKLVLLYLPKLTVFYQGAHALELPMLKDLEICDCPNFTSRYQDLQDNNEEGEVQVLESKSICLEHKINPNLERIRLVDDNWNNIKEIRWRSESKTLQISYMNISIGHLQRFYNLEVLCVDSNYRLMSLLSFSVYFQNLKVLEIIDCFGLIKRLITPSTTKSLVQLREMKIKGCKMLSEIVENEGNEMTTEIVFNNLNKLSLLHLDYLTCFYSGNYFFIFPSLKELIIKDCPNMMTFSSGSLNTPKLRNVLYEEEPITIGENDLNTIIQEASKKRVNFDLKKLTLSGRDIMSIWQREFEENLDKVETLELIKDERIYIPIHIFTKFVSLKQLELKVSSYKEIFSCEESEEHVEALAQLNVLQLWGLFNLKCIWKQDFHFKSILQNLHELSVVFCDNLMTLLPCSSSFKNLTTFKVDYCNGLQTLIASSTAKSLVCLEELKIYECEVMIEVLANEGDKEEDEIVFEKLKELTLVKLKSLTCFYSGNCVLNFPFLESLNVSECFKMKTFSGEGLDMPRLQKVNKKVCTNDLDSIIQQLQNDCSEFCERMRKEFREE